MAQGARSDWPSRSAEIFCRGEPISTPGVAGLSLTAESRPLYNALRCWLSGVGIHVRRFAYALAPVGGLAGDGDRGGGGGGGACRRQHRDGCRGLARRGEARGGAAERVLVGGDTPAQRGYVHGGGPRGSGRALGVARDRGSGRGGARLLPG